ncbi:MAG: formyltransferase family protein [bacterium]|nr:formyltransferase family protein [bacterium]
MMKKINIIQNDRKPLQDHCGILAAYSLGTDIPFFHHTFNGLLTLQTRGYDGAGLCAYSTDGKTYILKGAGAITDVFTESVRLEQMYRKAKLWIAQTRYGTKGGFIAENVQPFHVSHCSGEVFFVAHNGQFSFSPGDDVTKLSDTFIFAKELEQSTGKTLDEKIFNTVKKKKGAFSLIIGTSHALYLIRDSLGIRPLVYGELTGQNKTQIIVAASETEALIRMGVTTFFEVMPGTMMKFTDDKKITTTSLSDHKYPVSLCVFENVYLMDHRSRSLAPRSKKTQINKALLVLATRQKAGEILAEEAPLTIKDVDLAIGIPGTGIDGGESYARICGIPYKQAIKDKVKQKDQRTFMSAETDLISSKVLDHFIFDEKALAGKRVVLIDDSIVRGNVSHGLVYLLKKDYKVKEIHLRVLSPPIDKICYLGINTRKNKELIAARNKGNIDEIKKELKADSLKYLSVNGLIESITGKKNTKGFCMGCMAGCSYPIDQFGNKMKKNSSNAKVINVAILISNAGTGTNLQAIVDAIEQKKLKAKISVVVSSDENAYGLERIKKYNIPGIVVDKKADLVKLLKETYVSDYIVLAGWKRIIPNNFIDAFTNKILNLHPGIIPDTINGVVKNPDGTKGLWNKGKLTDLAIQNFLDNKSTYAGSTVHLLSKKFDFGPVLMRCFEKINKKDTVETLYKRLKQKENIIYVKSLITLCNF